MKCFTTELQFMNIMPVYVPFILSKTRDNWAISPSEEFELTADSLGAHMKVIESSPSMGHNELILRTFI